MTALGLVTCLLVVGYWLCFAFVGLLGLYVCASFRERVGLIVFAVGFGFIVLVC